MHIRWHKNALHTCCFFPSTPSRLSVINVLRLRKLFWPPPLCPPTTSPSRPPLSNLMQNWSKFQRVKKSEKRKKEKGFTLRPLPRPRAGSRTEPTTSLHGACPLCYSNSLVTVLNPRGSLTQALGSQAWLLTAPRWKALDIALHVTYSPGLAKSLETSASSLVCKD